MLIVERLRDAIHPDDSAGEPPLLPILNRYRPCGKHRRRGLPDDPPGRPDDRRATSTRSCSTRLGRPRRRRLLDASDLVKCYARNDHLGLVIPYEYMGIDHDYEPDFLVRLVNDLNLLLEIKGYEVHNPEQNNAKHNAAKWVTAVNNLGEFGRWDFLVVRDMIDLLPALAKLAPGKVSAQVPPAVVVDPLFPASERDRWLCASCLNSSSKNRDTARWLTWMP